VSVLDLFACALLIFSLFLLAQLVAMTQRLAAQEAAAGSSNTEDAIVEAPRNIGNLQAAMLLDDDSSKYRVFCVSQIPFLLSALNLLNHIYYRVMLQSLQRPQIWITGLIGPVKMSTSCRVCVIWYALCHLMVW
jgi:hypothetical protein